MPDLKVNRSVEISFLSGRDGSSIQRLRLPEDGVGKQGQQLVGA